MKKFKDETLLILRAAVHCERIDRLFELVSEYCYAFSRVVCEIFIIRGVLLPENSRTYAITAKNHAGEPHQIQKYAGWSQ